MQLRLEKLALSGLAVASELSDLLKIISASATVETDDNALIVNGDLGDLIDGCLSLEPLSTTVDRPSFGLASLQIFKSPKRNFRQLVLKGRRVRSIWQRRFGNSRYRQHSGLSLADLSHWIAAKGSESSRSKKLEFRGMFSDT